MSKSLPFDPKTALCGVPLGLRDPLIESYNSIIKNFLEGRWEPAELNGGKFCEIVFTILKGHIDGAFPTGPSKPSNMADACRALEQADSGKFTRAFRIQIPRMLLALYEIRNNRGVGHAGGDVNPNHMDALVIVGMSKWIMADLVRAFHNIDTVSANSVVDALVERIIPVIWNISGKKRVLSPNLSFKDKTLALVYSNYGAVDEVDLFNWVEHSNISVYRRDVLIRAHKAKLIEYNRISKTIHISPLGIAYVEKNIPLQI